jgi:hypothetical protein
VVAQLQLLYDDGRRPDRDLVAVQETLLALEAADPRAAKAVELRIFGCLELPRSRRPWV